MTVREVWKSLKKDGVYTDVTFNPPFASHHNIIPLRKKMLQVLPGKNQGVEHLFMPFTFNGEPFFSFGVENACLNHKYEPFTALFYVIRDHWRELYDFVSGTLIESEREYEDIRSAFNKHFLKILDGCGNGEEPKLCSVDEMIRLGSLFFLLQKSCDQSKGLVLDSERRFENRWCGRKVVISVTSKELCQYAEKLRQVWMSGLEWVHFLHRYIDHTNRSSLWFFNLPKIEHYNGGEFEQEFTDSELFHLFDSFVSIGRNEGYIFVLCPKDERVLELIKKHFFFKNTGGYRHDSFLYLFEDFYSDGDEYFAIANYDVGGSFVRSEVR